MKTFTTKQIQEKFDSLPSELQKTMTSPEINLVIESVAKKNGLMIDQMSELIDLVGLVMLGLVPSKDFVRELANEAEISEIKSKAITEDLNNLVFGKIKSLIQGIQSNEKDDGLQNNFVSQIPSTEKVTKTTATPLETKPSHITDLEKAGGFTIEHENHQSFNPQQYTINKIPNNNQANQTIEAIPSRDIPKINISQESKIEQQDKDIPQKQKSPLAEELLSVLNKEQKNIVPEKNILAKQEIPTIINQEIPTPKIEKVEKIETSNPVPDNLPIENIVITDDKKEITKSVENEKIQEPTIKAGPPEPKFIPPLKPEKVIPVETKTNTIPSSVNPQPLQQKTKNYDPYREPI